VSGAWLALLLAVSGAPLPAAAPERPRLPEGTARYRMVIGGEPVGTVELRLRCDGPDCRATWESRQRLPAEAGGGERARRVEVPVDPAGRARGPAEISEDGRPRLVELPAGAVPAMLAELALLAARPGPAPLCLDAADERSGRPVRACARRLPGPGGELEATVGRERERLRPGRSGFAELITLPGQRVAFRLDPHAEVPARAPRLFGTAVDGPAEPGGVRRFCGVPIDPRPAAGGAAGLPRPTAPGPSCRERTAAWLERLRASGLEGRTAVGVAWDGGGWVWHAWAEAAVGGRWVPVDPSFRQAPARGPRFTLATWGADDEAGRAEAGRRILACWGRAAVEGDAPAQASGTAAP